MGLRFGSAPNEPDEEISERHRAMIQDWVDRNLTQDDIDRAKAEEVSGPRVEWIDVRGPIDWGAVELEIVEDAD